MVIFAGGKFRENVGKTFHVGVIFTILLLFPSKRHIGLFSRGGNFRKKDKSAKNAKITPTRVYSISFSGNKQNETELLVWFYNLVFICDLEL